LRSGGLASLKVSCDKQDVMSAIRITVRSEYVLVS
jgi:hypothetical protein